jgi:copper chaperone
VLPCASQYLGSWRKELNPGPSRRNTPVRYKGMTEGDGRTMAETITYSVPAMTCDHCKHAVSSELGLVAGVTGVEVDLNTKLVTVTGEGLVDGALRGAIEEAGYEAV